MFSSEINGYNKEEVEKYINDLKTEHERSLMDEKLKILESEQKLLSYRKKAIEVEQREKNIYAVLDSFKKLQKESKSNIDYLRKEQLKIIYSDIQEFLSEIIMQYPNAAFNDKYKKILSDIENIIEISEDDKTLKNGDAVKLLTSKMYQSQNPKEIKIERESGSRIKPVCDLKLGKDDKYDTLVDKFLNTRPEDDELPKIEIQSSSFDLKEAINPKDDLSEIMKAFDFYGGNDEE